MNQQSNHIVLESINEPSVIIANNQILDINKKFYDLIEKLILLEITNQLPAQSIHKILTYILNYTKIYHDSLEALKSVNYPLYSFVVRLNFQKYRFNENYTLCFLNIEDAFEGLFKDHRKKLTPNELNRLNEFQMYFSTNIHELIRNVRLFSETTLDINSNTLLKESRAIELNENNPKSQSILSIQQANQDFDKINFSLKFLKNIFTSIDNLGVALLDENYTIITINSVLKDLSGKDNIHNSTLFDLFPHKERHNLKNFLNTLHTKVPNADELFEFAFGSREDKIVRLFVNKIKTEELPTEFIIVYCLDVTRQKGIELQFVQSQKMQSIGQLAGGLAHDFNNLLTTINGYSDLLLSRFKPGDPTFQDVLHIKQSANKGANTVKRLLAFSRQEVLLPSLISIETVLNGLQALLSIVLDEDIIFSIEQDSNLGYVKIDKSQFEQAMLNLAINAKDAMKNGGYLSIKAEKINAQDIKKHSHSLNIPEQTYIKISVSDTGTGIAPEHLEKIFEPFFTTKATGHGLGLSMVYGNIKQSGGYIFVKSQLGAGTTFEIYLKHYSKKDIITETPSEEKQIEQDIAQEPKIKNTQSEAKINILLVEDEPSVRTFVTRALKQYNYNIVEAEDGKMALDIVQKQKQSFDIVISDVIMPNIDGPTMVTKIKQFLPDIKIIFISGYTEGAFKENNKIHDYKFVFLPKPFSLKQLVNTVKTLLPSNDE